MLRARVLAGCALAAALGTLVLVGMPGAGAAQRGGPSLNVVGNFSQPIYAHGPNGAPGMLFVVEQAGVIRVLKNGEDRGVFLDIRDKVSCCGERGLFSIAFADWNSSRRFYVFFTDNNGDLRIAEFKRKRNNPHRAIKSSRRDLLDIRHRDAANHNGGQLQWGPGGNLYISTGDGATGGAPAQSKQSLLGKILRIDPLDRAGPGRYGIPRSNPYVGKAGANEIFARGLRNPFRFSLDGRKIVIGDVGEGGFEEVDYERLRSAAGANFGWPNYEGNNLRSGQPTLSNHDRPIHVYASNDIPCNAITGGYVVRDDDLPGLKGRYIYGDYCTGQIRSLNPKLGGAQGDSGTGLSLGLGLYSFGEDARNNIYVAHGSTVYRLASN